MLAMTRRLLGTVAVVLASIQSGVANAAWPSDPTVNVPVSTAAYGQVEPASVSDGAGGAIVAWTDGRSGFSNDIYIQRVSAAGVPQWTINGEVVCSGASNQDQPTIASDGEGGAIVAWADERNDIADIYAQRVNAAGVPQWTVNGVSLCSAAEGQGVPTIVSDGAGGAIVAWQDGRGGLTTDIYAQRVSATGVPLWTADGVAICTAAGSQYDPKIASDGAGGAIVTWYDERSGNPPSGTSLDIYIQRVNAAGVRQWSADGVPLCTATNGQAYPMIVSDGTGGAIVTWSDNRGAPVFEGIYAQRVNAAGVPQWSLDGVALCTAASNREHPQLASDGAGGAIVTWYDVRNGAWDIYAQRVDATGSPQWTVDGVGLCLAANDQFSPTIASDAVGGAIVTWYDDRSGTRNDIYAQRVNAAGAPQWAIDGVALSTAAFGLAPVIVSDGSNGAIVTWMDGRNGNTDLYAQNIKADGMIGGGSNVSAPPLSVSAKFALASVEPNPSMGDLRIVFSLSDKAPATLRLYDLTGRRIASQSVGSLGAGAHEASLSLREAHLPPGIYCMSLTQGSHLALRKVAIVR